MKVLKWKLSDSSLQYVEMPKGSTILSAQLQYGDLSLWALCDEEETAIDKRHIAICCTGASGPEGSWAHLGTVQLHGGLLVAHVFEVK